MQKQLVPMFVFLKKLFLIWFPTYFHLEVFINSSINQWEEYIFLSIKTLQQLKEKYQIMGASWGFSMLSKVDCALVLMIYIRTV